MRLTVDLIQSSLSYINPLKERELDLRGHKIPAIENLGAALDNDCIDFTDNDISQLGGFPLHKRLHSLLLAKNRIHAIQPTIAQSIPGLSSLVLTDNNLGELADLDPLAALPQLTHLVLMGNPVTRKENYRYWVIWRISHVRFLDFHKVNDAERRKAKELFGTVDAPTDLASKIMGIKSRTFDVPRHVNGDSIEDTKQSRVHLTEAEKKRFQDMIRNAKSLSEITRLEKEFSEGKIPAGVMDT